MTRRYDAARLRAALVPLALDGFVRIFPRRYARQPLGVGPGSSRFADPEAGYAVLYAGESVAEALWETLLRDAASAAPRRTLPRFFVGQSVLTRITTIEPLPMIDLRRGRVLRARVPTAVVRDRRHAAGQALSRFVHAEIGEAAGFVHDSRFTASPCVAIFDRALDRVRASEAIALEEVDDVHATLADHDVVLEGRGDG